MCNYPFLLLLRWQEWRKRIFDLNNGLYSDLKFIPKSFVRKTISIFVKTISNYYCPLKLIQIKKKNGLNSG